VSLLGFQSTSNRASSSAIIVVDEAQPWLRRHSMDPIERQIDERAPWCSAILRAMRPYQWVKNLLVFVPIVTAHAYGELEAWKGAVLIFGAFCAAASALYIVNDILDIAADRRHPRKRLRPFASGALPPFVGVVCLVPLLALGLSLAEIGHTLLVLLVYVGASLLYSVKLKELPLVDVFSLTGLYILRLLAGGEATGHRLSLWLLGFSSFFFLSLAFLKRVAELRSLATAGAGDATRRGYLANDALMIQIFGCCAAFTSSVILAIFVQSEATAERYASPVILWGMVPLLLFWQCRLWLSTARGYMHDDPIIYSARDPVTWAVIVCLVTLMTTAKLVHL
jgi:4-hydroxybenzoate polyprenyltransferase